MERQRRLERQRRHQRRRHDAVEQQSRADGVEPDALVAQQRRAVGGVGVRGAQAEFGGDLARRDEVLLLEREVLALGLVGRGEMGVQRFDAQRGRLEDGRQRAAQVVVAQAEPVHAGVDLDVAAEHRLARGGGVGQGPAGPRRRDGRRQSVREDAVEIRDAEGAEDEDRGGDTGLAQRRRPRPRRHTRASPRPRPRARARPPRRRGRRRWP